MRKSFKNQPYVFPQPVFIIATYDEEGNADAMNAAWGGISGEHELMMCLSAYHKTVKNILLKKEFTVSMGTRKTLVECDYFGIASGNKVKDKIKEVGFTTTKSELIDAPIINELPLTFECRLISYDKETEILRAEIVNCSADESILTDGKIDVIKLEPISYNGVDFSYLVIKEKVGNAFKDGKKFIK